jgi:uncharacterized membrane protein (DUF485 family)
MDQPHLDEDHPEITQRNSLYGLLLFAVYLILYGGFMALAAFKPQLMGKAPFGGMNLAVIYGIGLIVAALLLALFYMVLCRHNRPRENVGGNPR